MLFIIGANITSVIEKFFREPVSAQFDQLKSITLKYVLFSQLDFRNFSGSFNNNKMLLEKGLCKVRMRTADADGGRTNKKENNWKKIIWKTINFKWVDHWNKTSNRIVVLALLEELPLRFLCGSHIFCGVPFLFERVFAVNVVSLSMPAKSLSKITECQAEVVRTFMRGHHLSEL